MGRHQRSGHHVWLLVFAVLLVAGVLLVLTVGSPRQPRETADTGPVPTTVPTAAGTGEAAPVAGPSPFAGVGTWLSRYRFTREFGGGAPPVSPADVDAMADAGVRTLYLQPAADDPAYPGLLSTDLLGEFLVRAHQRGVQVVAWYLPHFTDTDADLRRLQEIAGFRADGEAFDAIAVDIEFTEDAALPERNAALVDLSTRLRAAVPDVVLGAVVLPPVVTDVINLQYWPDFPWAEIAASYDVWLPMAYWSDREDPVWSDAYRYVGENVRRLREHLGDPCAVVSVVGGYDVAQTAEDYAGMARAAAEEGAIGVSIWDWPTTPAAAWPSVTGYDGQGC